MRNWIAAILGVLSVVVMPAVVAWFVWRGLPVPKDLEVFAAAFGDIVGPLFAALAFAGLIYTALMQREELSLQRVELKQTREELERTANAQEASEKALTAQVKIAQLSARLNAATALLNHYETLAARLSPVYVNGPKEKQERKDVLDGRKEIQNEIFQIRDELVGEVKGEGEATLPTMKASGAGEVRSVDT